MWPFANNSYMNPKYLLGNMHFDFSTITQNIWSKILSKTFMRTTNQGSVASMLGFLFLLFFLKYFKTWSCWLQISLTLAIYRKWWWNQGLNKNMTKLNGTTELLPSKSKVPIYREKEKLNTVKKKRSFIIYKM